VWDREGWGMLADDVAALAPDEGETVGDVYCRGRPHPEAREHRGDA
jgi:hypothetical protein